MSPRSTTPSDWQLAYTGIRERTAHLLQAALWTDCTFIVGAEGEVTFTGHKVILAIASPVFEAMFFGPVAEGNKPILIPDIQPEAFKILLEYVYTDTIQIYSHEQACDVFYAAKKYMLPQLVKRCSYFLQTCITLQNVCQTYEMAALFQEFELMETCMAEIRRNTSKVLTEPSFLDINMDTMVTIFSQTLVNVTSELEMFHAAERYVMAKGVRLNACPDCATKAEPVKDTIVTPSSSKDSEGKKESTEVLSEGKKKSTEVLSEGKKESTEVLSEGKKESTEVLNELVVYEDCDKEIDAKVPDIRRAVHQIRFLSLDVNQLARALVSGLVRRSDALGLLVAAATNAQAPPMYSTAVKPRIAYRTHPKNPPVKSNENEEGEGTIEFSLYNLKSRKRMVESMPICVNGLQWKVQVSPEGEIPQKSLSVFVVPSGGKGSWETKASVIVRLVDQRNSSHIQHSFTHTFTRNGHAQGWKAFASWETICDPARGFLKSNGITVQVRIRATGPKILPPVPVPDPVPSVWDDDSGDSSDY